MAYDQSPGTASLRAEFVDSTVKGFAERMYKFKQAVTIQTTAAWENSFYREKSDPLTSAGGLATVVPRGAQPAQGSPTWERVTDRVDKFFYEDVVFWEDVLMDEIQVQPRVLYKVAEKITKDVDDTIWNKLSDSATATTTTVTNIQLVSVAAGKHWSGSSAAIIDDIHNALALIATSNYDTSNCMMFVNPRDRRSIMRWLSDKGAQFPSIGEDIGRNGFVGQIAGVRLVVSNSVAASHALVVVPQICGTWKEAVSFRTTTIEDPYRAIKIRAVEEGVCHLTDPQAVVLIANTRGDDT